MNLRIGVTDGDWFRFLASRPHLDEVNFWQPSGRHRFQALQPGELFLFKLHAPQNYIVGGGFFVHASLLPVDVVWQSFGEENGAASYEEMRRRIVKYRRTPDDPRENPQVGCIILGDPFFLDESAWIPVPADFTRNIVQGKNYDLRTSPGRELWQEVLLRREIRRAGTASDMPRPMFGEPVLVRPRLGQGAFRTLVTDVYQRRCAVTGERALPVLQAAHIRPVTQEGQHEITNGLLLRSGIHTLYDRGYLTVTPDLRFRTSRRLKVDYDNGDDYRKYEGGQLWVPADPAARPDPRVLEWHADRVFLK